MLGDKEAVLEAITSVENTLQEVIELTSDGEYPILRIAFLKIALEAFSSPQGQEDALEHFHQFLHVLHTVYGLSPTEVTEIGAVAVSLIEKNLDKWAHRLSENPAVFVKGKVMSDSLFLTESIHKELGDEN